MATNDYLNQGFRKQVIQEILENEENKRRKEESLIALEIFKGRQAQFILDRIKQELGTDAAIKSRTITSINLTRKIIKEQSSIYKNDPTREFEGLNDNQTQHALKLYDTAMANVKFKKANEIYKLCDQTPMQIILKDGKFEFRNMYPHHYDVVPVVDNPEVPECYIVSSFDKTRLFNSTFNFSGPNQANSNKKTLFSDGINQKIGDPDDYMGSFRFIWWTRDFNFITDGFGNFIGPDGRVMKKVSDKDLINPIGVLPFVDIATDKDYEFYVRSGYSAAQLTIDLGLLFSDVSEIARLQGFSQGVISSMEEPRDIVVGPRRVMWLKKLPNVEPGAQPEFNFVSPSPDLGNSLQLISNYLSMALTSQGLSPKMINAAGEKEMFTSGVDRFLAGIEKFESSQEDISLFKSAESKVWDIMKAWNNKFYNVTDNGFNAELSGVYLPDESKLSVKYMKPQMLLSETDKLSVIEKKLDLGLISQAEAVAIDREIPIEMAKKVAEEIKKTDLDILTDGETETDIDRE
jgi:hypothetical protein